jgi:hypothetical protein
MVSQTKLVAFISAGLAFLGALFTIIGGGGILSWVGGIIAGVCGLLAVMFLRYGYILLPMITQHTKVVVMTDTGFEVPPSQDVILKKAEGLYYASAFLGIRIHESASEKTLEENIAYNEYFERAISNLKYVSKISYMLYVEDITEKRKNIEAKRAEAQLRLAREREKPEPDVLRIDKFEKEVGSWDTQLNKLIKGIKPMGVIAYAMTTASGVSKEGATASVKAQAKELKSALENTLNVEIEWLTADEMMKCFDWEMFLPTSPQELEESAV